jgi:ferredoxin
MNFCLFGTYGLSAEDRVQVVKPSGCKTNCPACARMCPRQAIIFPKYADSPINGDIGAAPDSGQPKVTAGDVYERIRNRSAGKRFSTQTGDPSNRSCPTLDSLKRELNIPDDVLASLSPAEMQRITRQSKTDAEKKGENPHE